MKCDLAGEDGEKGRRGRVPSSYGMWWEQYLGLPSPPQPWLGSGFGTPSQCGLYDSLPLLTRIFPSINFGGRGGCKYCFLKKWIWWYVLVMALPIWSSSIELNWISWTTNSSKTIAQYIHENKYYITLPSLQNLVLFWSRNEKFLLSRSYCLALLLGQFLGGVVGNVFRIRTVSATYNLIGWAHGKRAFRGAATSFPYVFILMLVEEENDMKWSRLSLLIALKGLKKLD